MSNQRYVVITLEHAHLIAAALAHTGAHRGGLRDEAGESASETLSTIYDRFLHETGADMQEIVDIIHDAKVCFVCENEGQARGCNVPDLQKQGRRLRRLLERARGERKAGQ